jgi:CDP-diacylglycerol--serine O-phosphatidyltransferase
MSEKKSLFIIKLNRVDLITLSSVLTTFVALIWAMDGHLYFSMAMLFVAMTADAMDGMLARKWQLEREFGRYLDGFMDVLIYLVVPAVILVQWGFNGYFSIFILLMIGAGCVRLSVFNQTGNIKESNGLSYLGMPVFWSVFLIAGVMLLEFLIGHQAALYLMALVLLVFSFYMVVSKPFFKFSSLQQILLLTIGGFSIFACAELAQFGQQSPLMYLLLALYLQIPVVIGGVWHMVVVSKDQLSFLKKPINQTLFGANKTWRGMVVVPLLTAIGGLCLWPAEYVLEALTGQGLLSAYEIWYVGLVAGVGYVLAELPNSFYKRRIGIQPGEVPEDKKYWFIALDQLDSAIGVALAYWLVLGVSFESMWIYIITFPITALLVKQWLFNNNLKSSAA